MPSSDSEPNLENTPVPEPEDELESAWAEPEPDWSSALPSWGIAWDLHVYISAGCYLIVFLLAVFSVLYFLKSKQTMKQGKLTISLLFMLIVFTVLRGTVMLIDPYGTTGVMPGDYFRTLWSLALPGLTASFSVLLLVLLDTTKMSLGPPRFQKLSTILIFTALHFTIVIASDVAFSLCDSCRGMLLFCQVLFILYGAFLSVGYMYSSIAIHKNCAAGNQQGYESRKILRLSKAAAIASVVAFTIFVTYIYAASSEFGIYSNRKHVDAWHWWSLQTILRLEEIVTCCLVLMIAFRNPCEGVCSVSRCFGKIGNSRTLPDLEKTNDLGADSSPGVTVATIQISPRK